MLDDLNAERETHKDTMPYAFLSAKMKQIGLDVYTHNFTLNYPFGGGKKFTGKNVYGILRAPRIASTESIVLTVPYRAPTSMLTDISYGVPLILAFADFARKQKYWAKDIIFLITEQEQLGVQAWLEAYHGFDDNAVLRSGSLDGRAGQIQAAINLEVQDFDIQAINIKLEGLFGSLPNLDLHNLVQKLSHKQSIPTGYKLSLNGRRGYTYEERVLNLLSAVLSQANGVPTGNHGLFHKYGIEALTLECIKNPSVTDQRRRAGIISLSKIIEGVVRSLNNLLERFHQSYFFYLIVSYDRFVSIGDYMPCIGLMAGALLLKSFILWLSITYSDEDPTVSNPEKSKSQSVVESKKTNKNANYLAVGAVIIVAHAVGVVTSYLPFLTKWNDLVYDKNIPTEQGVFYALQVGTMIGLMLALWVKLKPDTVEVLHVAVCLELGTILIAIGMINFSLGFLLCTFITPFIILLDPIAMTKTGARSFMFKGFYLLFHPLIVVFFIVLALAFAQFSEQSVNEIFPKAYKAMMDALTHSVVDSLIYGNIMFDLCCLCLYPCWIMLWMTFM